MGKRTSIAALLAFALWAGSALAQAPSLTATWTAPHTASVTWAGGELWKISQGLETHIDRPSPVLLGLGGDSAYAPREGDRFEVRSVTTGAVLASVVLGLPPSRLVLPLIVVGERPVFEVRLVLVVK